MIPNCERSNKWFSPFLHKLICLFCLVCVSLSLKHRERTKHPKVHVSHYDCSLSLILFLTFWDGFSRQEGALRGSGFDGLRIRLLLFADDVVLFQVLLEKCAVGCEASGMEISSSKSEAMFLSVCPLWFNNDILPTWRISGVWGSGTLVRVEWSTSWCFKKRYWFHTGEILLLTAYLLQQAAQREVPSKWFLWD